MTTPWRALSGSSVYSSGQTILYGFRMPPADSDYRRNPTPFNELLQEKVDLVLAGIQSSVNLTFERAGQNQPAMSFFHGGREDISWALPHQVSLATVYSAGGANVDPGTAGFSTLLHETLHALGLKHPFDLPNPGDPQFDSTLYTQMTYRHFAAHRVFDDNGNLIRVYPMTLMQHDFRTLQAVAGEPGHVAGQVAFGPRIVSADDPYRFDPGFGVDTGNTIFGNQVRTIWDAGGNDTFDASQHSARVEIRLAPGDFSSIGMYRNIAIALPTYTAETAIEAAIGGSGNDLIQGNAYANLLTGGAGNDSLEGLAGQDTYVVGLGLDVVKDTDAIVGGQLRFHGEANAVSGGAQTLSHVWKGPGETYVRLSASGSDGAGLAVLRNGSWAVVRGFGDGPAGLGITLAAGSGFTAPTTSYTLQGDRVLQVPGVSDDWGNAQRTATASANFADVFYDTPFADRIVTGGGDDAVATAPGQPVFVSDDWITLGMGADLAHGSFGNDLIEGNEGPDLLFGGSGNDRLFGEQMISTVADLSLLLTQPSATFMLDWLDGGEGDDLLVGSNGADVLLGGIGKDALYGGGGADDLFGDGVSATFGRSWNRVRTVTPGPVVTYTLSFQFATVVDEQQGDDDVLSGGMGEDWILAGAGNDFASGGGDHDVIWGYSGSDVLEGNDGNDVLSGDAPEGGSGYEGLAGGLHGDDYLQGGAGSDTLYGNGGADWLFGDDGDDVLDGDDALTPAGFHGADQLDGGAGNDILYGRGAADVLAGGDGADTLLGDASTAGELPLVAHGADTLFGGAGDDQLYGQGGRDTLEGGLDNDYLEGGGGDDLMFGGDGNDTLYGDDSSGSNTGPAGLNVLFGGAGNDIIYGGENNDTLSGDAGDDLLRGRMGADVYEFAVGEGHDTVDPLFGGDVSSTDLVQIYGGYYQTPGEAINASRRYATISRVGNDGSIRLSFAALGGQAESSVTVLGFHLGSVSKVYFANADIEPEMQFGQIGIEWRDIASSVTYDAVVVSAAPGSEAVTGRGQDVVTLTGGGNAVRAGAGNDTLTVAGSNNSYFYEAGDGFDRISFGASSGSNNRVVFGQGITSDMLSARLYVTGLEELLTIELGSASDALRLMNTERDQVLGAARAIDRFEFTDAASAAASLSYADLIARGVDVIGPGAAVSGSRSVFGTNAGDRLSARHGNFTSFYGGEGNDTYVLEHGDGADSLHDLGTQAGDTIMFGPGVSFEQLRIWKDAVSVVIGYGATDQITVNGGIEFVRFADTPDAAATPWAAIESAARVLIEGTAGADVLAAPGAASHELRGLAGNDSLTGNAGNDVLLGGLGDDTLEGGIGSDELDGGSGADRMVGGAGNDLYRIDSAGDLIVEATDGGHDTAIVYADGLTLPDHVEDIFLFDQAYTSVTGGAGANLIRGNYLPNALSGGDGNDTLEGLDGNDTLTGGPGIDRLIGGAGDDRYIVGDSGDVVVELAGAGTDVVEALADYTLSAEVEQLVLVGSAVAGTGNALANRLTGNGSANLLSGADGNDTMLGGNGNDTLLGGAGADSLLGEAGADSLDGGAGADLLDGGTGNDTYVLAVGGGADTLRDLDTTVGNSDVLSTAATRAQVQVARLGADLVLTLRASGDSTRLLNWFSGSGPLANGSSIENFQFSDGLYTKASLTLDPIEGSAGNDSLVGTLSNDTMFGLGGGDTLVGGFGDDLLNGGEGNDRILGDAMFVLDSSVTAMGYDTLEGGPGDDYLFGGALRDTYVYSSGDGNDTIEDQSYIVPSANRLFKNILSLNNIAQSDVVVTRTGLNDTDLLLTDTAGGGSILLKTHRLEGDGLVRSLFDQHPNRVRVQSSATSEDVIYDMGSSFTYPGGAETLRTFLTNPGGMPFFAVDEVRFGSSGTWMLTDLMAKAISPGTSGNDLILGWQNLTGGDSLAGGDGNDTLVGLAGYDTLDGGSGDDRLDGGSGVNSSRGGFGNDTYVIDFASSAGNETSIDEIQHVPFELLLPFGIEDAQTAWTRRDLAARYQGIDTIETSVGSNLDLRAEIENLRLTGSAVSGRGNFLANLIEGNAGANLLNGVSSEYSAADTLRGGDGNDTYEVDGSVVLEELAGAAAGNDLVRASIDYILPANVERLELVGSASISGTGNSSANVLSGNAGANRLDGLAGGDTMAGGAGNDTYVVDSADDVVEEAANAGIDQIELAYLNPTWSILPWYQPFTMANHVERLSVQGNVQGFVSVVGNGLDNRIESGGFASSSAWSWHTIMGGDGNDTLLGGNGRDLLFGESGDDSLQGGAGDDTLRGGAGSDTYAFDFAAASGVDRIEDSDMGVFVGSGVDDRLHLLGAPLGELVFQAIDTFDLQISRQGVAASNRSVVVENWFRFDLAGQRDNIDQIVVGSEVLDFPGVLARVSRPAATPVDDRLVGSSGSDTLDGGGGDDTLHGMEGNDVLVSGTGVNRLFGGPGNDSLDASANAAGGYMGGAYLDGGTGADTMRGGLGSDTYVIDDPGDVVIEVLNGGSNDLLEIWTPSYQLSANVESAVQNISVPGTSRVIGNAGANYFHVQGGALIQAGGGDDTVSGASMIAQGGTGHDRLVGTQQSLLHGGSGTDVLDGGYYFGTQADLFVGGSDQDVLLGGMWSWDMENEMYWGDSGSDVVLFREGDGADSLVLTPTGNQTLSISGFRLDEISLVRAPDRSVNYPYGTITTTGDLELRLGGTDRITLQFSSWGHASLARLQVFIEDEEYSAAGGDPLRDDRVEWFDFRGIAGRLGSAANAVLSGQQIAQALLDFHAGGSEDSAFGGDIAAYYHRTGSLEGMGRTFAHQVLGSPGFGTSAQPLRSVAELQTGEMRLG